ncbi:MAG: hypothetical protein MUC99_13090 [Anaerolineae bacterium]|nr:hypothetical protein [Anaerolineae bacterium]
MAGRVLLGVADVPWRRLGGGQHGAAHVQNHEVGLVEVVVQPRGADDRGGKIAHLRRTPAGVVWYNTPNDTLKYACTHGATPMKSTLHALAALVALLTLTTAAFAQEEAEAAQQVAPQGLGLMMLLVGLAAILVVGLFMGRRESGDADDLV